MSERKLSDGAARQALDQIHRVMTIPFDWSSDTLDDIGDLMVRAGYRWPDRADVDRWEEEGWNAFTLPDEHISDYQPKDV